MEMYSIYYDVVAGRGVIVEETNITVGEKDSDGYFEFDQAFSNRHTAKKFLDYKSKRNDEFYRGLAIELICNAWGFNPDTVMDIFATGDLTIEDLLELTQKQNAVRGLINLINEIENRQNETNYPVTKWFNHLVVGFEKHFNTKF